LPDVRYDPDSDQIPQRSEMTLCASTGSRAVLRILVLLLVTRDEGKYGLVIGVRGFSWNSVG
jgi:hypothetical protein